MVTEQAPVTTGEQVESKKTQQFDFAKNQNIILGALAAVLLVVIAFVGYKQYYLPSKNAEAQDMMFGAQQLFNEGKYQEALNGAGTSVGFLTVAEDYGSTRAGKLAHLYAGLSYRNLGDLDNAIKHLEQFESDDVLLGAYALGALGDAYGDKGNMDKAIQYYKDAANHHPNEQTTPEYLVRAALALESQGKGKEALELLQKAKLEYPNYNPQSMELDTHIARLEQKQ